MSTDTDPSPDRARATSGGSRPHRVCGRLEPAIRLLRSRFEVDTRALAALRISLGLILLVNLSHRAGDLRLFYTDDGVYPRSVYETASIYSGYSVHALSGDLWFQQLLFVLAGLFALALIVGYRSRLVAFVSFALLLSLHARNPAVLNGGDRLLLILLFLALLTPLGERWSVDASRRGSARARVASFATAALLVQPLAVFTSNAILKRRGETWYTGDAVETALANDAMTILLGNHLGSYPALLAAATWLWVALLAGSIVFLLLPVGRTRAAFALAYLGAFAGMGLTLAVGLFPLVLGASILPFLTTPFWDRLVSLLPVGSAGRRPVAARLGPLEKPPVERRLLERLRRTGRERCASLVVDFGRSVLTAVGLVLLVWIVLFSATHATGLERPAAAEATFPDEQRWGLYAPDPSSSYSWYVVEAELEDGPTADALESGAVTTDRPPDVATEYDTFRHRKFMESVRDSGLGDSDAVVADRYAEWACERAQSHDKGIHRISVTQFVQPSPLEGEYEEPTDRSIVDRECDRS